MAYMVKQRQHLRPRPALLEHRHLGSELEIRRSAHLQRPLAGRRVLRPPLLVQLDRAADAGTSAAAADARAHHRHLGTVVVRFDHHARHEQHASTRTPATSCPGSGAAITRSRPATSTATTARCTTGPTAATRRRSSTAQRPLPIFSTPFTARVIRDFITPAFFDQHSVYLQDTYSRKRFTAILGLRWDRQEDNVAAVNMRGARLSGPGDDRRDAVQPVSGARRPGQSAPEWSGTPWRRESASPTI